ncbi:Hcp family type VI secretion system effector [Glaciecola sp. 1036]|uniref:Hcp family type VI secretion system effector n=1 Tax=Alteromonadaceae TaxID=72275 RepID=UPI003CFEC8E5
MAVDMFLELDKIKGEARDKDHKEDIDIITWSWGLSQSGSTHVSTGSGIGKANFQDISITKYTDKSSVTLMEYVATGKHIDKGKLVVRKAGGKPLEYIVMEFKHILVSSISVGGSGGEDLLTETITLNFAEVKLTYVPQKPDGSGGAKIDFGFNIPENKKI